MNLHKHISTSQPKVDCNNLWNTFFTIFKNVVRRKRVKNTTWVFEQRPPTTWRINLFEYIFFNFQGFINTYTATTNVKNSDVKTQNATLFATFLIACDVPKNPPAPSMTSFVSTLDAIPSLGIRPRVSQDIRKWIGPGASECKL